MSDRPGIYLTFDDGPNPTWTPRVLEALRAAGAQATFFVVASLARRHPAPIREMVREGHAVGLHCVRHVRHTDLERDAVREDTGLGLRILASLGLRPRLWRTPWGVAAPWTAEVARGFDLALVPWTADSHDWRGDAAQEMLAEIEADLRPGAVVLMHDGLGPGARRTGCEETVALIGDLVRRIRDLGCEPVPLGDATLPSPREVGA